MAAINEQPEPMMPPSSYPSTPSPTFFEQTYKFPEPQTLGPIDDEEDLIFAERSFAPHDSSLSRISLSENGFLTDSNHYRGVVESPPPPMAAPRSEPDFYKSLDLSFSGGSGAVSGTWPQKEVGLGFQPSFADTWVPSLSSPDLIGIKPLDAYHSNSKTQLLHAAKSLTYDSLQPAPRFLERYTSFQTTEKPEVAIQVLLEALGKHDADMSFNQSRRRLDGVVYPQNTCCRFKVKMYQGKSDGEIYVEFQRRTGNCIAFSGFFKSIVSDVARLNPKPLIPSLASFPKPQPMKTQSLRTEREGAQGASAKQPKSTSTETLKALFLMARSNFEDVRLNAAEVLASISERNSSSLVTYNPDSQAKTTPLVVTVKSLLTSKDSATLRATAVLLRNCFTHPEHLDCKRQFCLGCQAGETGLLDACFDVIDVPSSIHLTDAQRKITCALGTFMKTHPKFVSNDQSRKMRYVAVMQRLRECSSCKSLRDHCESAIQTIMSTE